MNTEVTPEFPEPLITPDDACKLVGAKNKATLAAWRGRLRKNLKYVKIGSGRNARIFYRASDIAEFLRSCTVDPAAPHVRKSKGATRRGSR